MTARNLKRLNNFHDLGYLKISKIPHPCMIYFTFTGHCQIVQGFIKDVSIHNKVASFWTSL